MEIKYQKNVNISKDNLVELFKSVEWTSANYPEKLYQAIINYDTVISAWDNNECIGLVAAMDDSVMTAYIQYVLVNPKYQKQGVGKTLLNKMIEHYDFIRKIYLISASEATGFYKKQGFEIDDGKPMIYENLNYCD